MQQIKKLPCIVISIVQQTVREETGVGHSVGPLVGQMPRPSDADPRSATHSPPPDATPRGHASLLYVTSVSALIQLI